MKRDNAPRRRLPVPVLALLLAGATPLLTGGVGSRDDFAARILAAHNRERTALGVPRLVWSETLSGEAAAWAEHLSTVGHLAHAPEPPDERESYGENLWAGTSRGYAIEQMFDFWAAERARFRPGRFPDNGAGGIAAIGHYTQLIWRRTSEVGCAIADNGRREYLVCRYREPGNVLGERPF